MRAILSHLSLHKFPAFWLRPKSSEWVAVSDSEPDVGGAVRALSWFRAWRPRTLVSNVRVPFLRNQVDCCLLDWGHREYCPEVMASPHAYLALGEVKGGIDPAAARVRID